MFYSVILDVLTTL